MKIKYSYLYLFLSVAFYFCLSAVVRAGELPSFLNGITLEDTRLLTADESLLTAQEIDDRNSLKKALENLNVPTVIRVVFDNNTGASDYYDSLDYLRSLKLSNGKQKFFIMGEMLDSDYLAQYRWDCKKNHGCSIGEEGESFHDYKARVNQYLTELDQKVDIWEVGNEVNGEWADEGCVKKSDGVCFDDEKDETDSSGKKGRSRPNRKVTAQKIVYAVKQARSKKKQIAITLIHQPECTTWNKNGMLDWSRNELQPLISNFTINYLLISYYEDNCDNGAKTIAPETSLTVDELASLTRLQKDQRRREIYWTQTFNELGNIFPKVEHLGFGEVGYSSDMKSCVDRLFYCKEDGNRVGKKTDLLDRYYGIQVHNSKYIGGHFWWTAQQDLICPDFYSRLLRHFRN